MRKRLTGFGAGVAVAFWTIVAAGAAWLAADLESDTSARVFLRPDDPVRHDLDALRSTFGGDAFVLVTCRGGPDPDAVAALAGALRALAPVAHVVAPDDDGPITRALRLRGEGRLSLAVALRRQDRGALTEIDATLARFPRLAAATAGQPALNVALRDASDQVGRRLFPLLAGAMVLLLVLAYRDVRAVFAALATTVVVVLVGLGMLAAAREPINLLTILLPVLLLALTVALCIHLASAFRRARAAGLDAPHAAAEARRAELRPCLLTSLTTAAGFGSLGATRIEPLRVLGIVMALSILAAFAVAYTLLPALLVLFRARPREGLSIGALLVRVVPPLLRRRRTLVAAFAVLLAAGTLVVPRIPRETNALRYLSAGHPLRTETERLAADGVGTASIELVLRGPDTAALVAPVRALDAALGAWQAEPGSPLRGVVTPLTILREAARRAGARDHRPLEPFLAQPAPAPLEEALAPFRNLAAHAARLSVRLDTVDVDAYHAIRSRLDGLVTAACAARPDVRATYSGDLPVVMTVQEELLHTLLRSLAGSAATIFTLLAIAWRSLRAAALTLLPAAAPIAFLLLACATFGVPLSIATVMVLAVTLGIVTDDSVHMMQSFRDGCDLEETLRRVGTAVTETSIAIFLGFAVLGFAAFLPTRDFGLLTAGAMVVALAADLLLFPLFAFKEARPCAAS
jgi:predicted RND superfamily exporter protein